MHCASSIGHRDRCIARRARAASAVREIEAKSDARLATARLRCAWACRSMIINKIVQDAASCRLTSLDDAGPDEESPCIARRMTVPIRSVRLRTKASARLWRNAIEELPERERMVMSLYYDDELNLKEIGAVLKVTESRVCQLHGQALVRLKARLTAWDGTRRRKIGTSDAAVIERGGGGATL